MRKILFLIIAMILLMGIVSAGKESLEAINPGETARIVQTCPDATYVNISSVAYPNSSVAVENVSMIPKGNGEWYYYFNLTQVRGRYDIRGISNGCEEAFIFYLPVGKESSVGESILYILLMTVMLLTLSALIYLSFTLKFSNEKSISQTNGDIFVTKVTKTKYIKLGCILFSYGLLLWNLNMLSGILVNFISLQGLARMVTNTYMFFNFLSRPVLIFILILVLINIWRDLIFNKEILKFGKSIVQTK